MSRSRHEVAGSPSVEDRAFLRLALRQGRRGLGRTRPNPPVGAVVVRNGEVVGLGFHRRAGLPHAEVEALRAAGAKARGATIYVTLEPCAHQGRTPPCTEAVKEAGIRRVVFGARDPNPHVAGGGAEQLRAAGLAVLGGVEEAACAELIAGFTRLATSGRPWVTLKLAGTLDGRIATRSGDSRWITNEASRRLVHRLRDEHDAVLVGAGTVRADDPELTCRRRGGRHPLRIVLDGRLRIPLSARVVREVEVAPTLVVTSEAAAAGKVARLEALGVEVWRLPGRDGRVSFADLLQRLGQRGLLSVLVEGGGEVAAAALAEKSVDRLLLFLAPKVVGGDGRPMLGSLGIERMVEALPMGPLRVRRLAGDLLVATEPGFS